MSKVTQPRKIKNIYGGFHDVKSFREETQAPVAEISDAEIVLLIESDKAHQEAHRHKQQSTRLYVENTKLRHLAGLPPVASLPIAKQNITKQNIIKQRIATPHPSNMSRSNTSKSNMFDQTYWLDQITSPVKPTANKPTANKPTVLKKSNSKKTVKK